MAASPERTLTKISADVGLILPGILSASVLGTDGSGNVSGSAAPVAVIVSSLPGSPTDGQEILFQTSAMATAGVPPYRLRYRSGASGSYKWDVIGAVPWFAEVTTQQSTSSNAYVDLATAGPSITVPLAGDYLVEGGAATYASAGAAVSFVGIRVNASTLVQMQTNFAGTSQIQHPMHARRASGLSAADVVKLQYGAFSGGTAEFLDRWLTVIPLRVG